MERVQLKFTVAGDEGAVHPLFHHLTKEWYVDKAQTIQWTCSKDTISAMHLLEGNSACFETAIESIPSVYNVELAQVDDDQFYVYHNLSVDGETSATLDALIQRKADVLPPIEYASDGTATAWIIGRRDALQRIITIVPESLQVEVCRISELRSDAESVTSLLTKRQRETLLTAIELGYYETPRSVNQGDVANEIGCSESTAGEHLRKAESKLLQAAVGSRAAGRQ